MDSIKELELALFAENQKRQDVERQLAEAIAARDESQRALQHVRDQMQHAVELTTKDAFRRGVESELENSEALLASLELMTEHYTSLINSGDAGHWNPEDESEVIQARKAIAFAKGQK